MYKRVFYLAGALLVAALLLTFGAVTWSAGACDGSAGCSNGRQPESASVATAGGWIYEAVDVPKNFIIYNLRWMAVDGAGSPHVAYGGDVLRYATQDGQEWQRQVVDDGIMVGSGAALTLDSDGRPHIAYLDTNLERVKYAHWTGDTWLMEYVDDTFSLADYRGIAIAVDSQDIPAIVYLKGHEDLYLARPAEGGWSTQKVAAGYGNWWPSLAFDNADRPLISYSDRQEGQIRLSSWTGSAWDHQTVFTVADQSYDYLYASSLVVDQSGQARIAFLLEEGDYTGDQTYVEYAHLVDGQWQVDRVAATDSYIGAALQLDGGGRPHIVANDFYAVLDGDTWTVEPLSGGSFPSLDLTPGGQPCMTYYAQDSINFALRDQGVWQPETVEQRDATGPSSQSIDLAVTSGNLIRASYFNSDNQVVHAAETTSTWQISEVAAGQWRGTASLALDAQERPWIAYPGYHNGSTVDLARWTGTAWLTETVDFFSSDEPIILQLDSQDRPHVAYGTRRYAAWNGAAWEERVLDASSVGQMWMVMDSQDQAHFVYREYASGENYLRHSVWVDDAWVNETVQTHVSALAVRAAVDGSDHLHVIYHDNSDGDLMYMVKKNGSWISETIATVYATLETDLVVDENGSPTVLYITPEYNPSYMHLARRGPDEWDVEVVGKTKILRASLALDAQDRPVLAFYSAPNGGIYLASKPDLDQKVFLPRLNR
ncbi:MAG: hypothetical protein ACK2UH_14070 [Candidatus Promineifilaceae bacterium]